MIAVNKFNVDEIRETCLKKVESSFGYDSAESNFLVFCLDRLIFEKGGFTDSLDLSTRQRLEDFIIGCYWLGEDDFCSQLAEVVSSRDLSRAIETGNQEFIVNTIFNLMSIHHEEGAIV